VIRIVRDTEKETRARARTEVQVQVQPRELIFASWRRALTRGNTQASRSKRREESIRATQKNEGEREKRYALKLREESLVASVREVKSRARVWRSKEWLWRVLFAREKEEREGESE